MMNKYGYSIKELIILFSVLAVVFAFGIARVSYAYQEAADEERTEDIKNNAILVASEAYAKKNPDKFSSPETFIYGSDLIEAGFLMDIDDFDYKNTKVRVVYIEATKSYKAEVMN